MTDKETQNPEMETPEQAQQQTVTEEELPEQEAAAPQAQQQDTEALQKQLEEVRNKYLYLLSDFENFKRNASKERLELTQTASRELMSALLPVLDDFDRAAKSDEGLPEGIALIHHKLMNTLQSKGLRPIATQPGDGFNADVHEAVAEIPAANEESKGKIIDVLEHGFFLGERIIRYAKVVVGK